MAIQYLGRDAEFDKYRHIPRDTDNFYCGLFQGRTDNAPGKPDCEDCLRRSKEVWKGAGIGYVVEN